MPDVSYAQSCDGFPSTAKLHNPPVWEFGSKGYYLLCVDFLKIHTFKIRSDPVWVKLDLKTDSVDL